MEESDNISTKPTKYLPSFIISAISIIILYHWLLTHWSRRARLINAFPGPSQFPLLGNLNLLLGPVEDFVYTVHSLLGKYGNGSIVRFWIGHKPYLLVADGRIAEKVLSGYVNVEKGDDYSALHRVLNQSIATAPGSKWRKDRKSLNPAFNMQHFDGFMKVFNERSKIMMQVFNSLREDEPMNLLPYFNRCTLDAVFQTALGSIQDAQRNPNLAFVEKMKGIVHCTREKLLKPHLTKIPFLWHLFGPGKDEDRYITELMAYSGNLIDKKITEMKETGQVSGVHTKPFIAYLMEGGGNGREEIAYHINSLCFAGSETSASALNYLLFLLALNPDCRNRMREEIDAVFGSRDLEDFEELVSLADSGDLKYTEMCIKETLRLYPPVPLWVRRIQKEVDLEDGRIIPVGTQVVILPYEIHRNPTIYPKPEVFNPERFADNHKPGWWIPFSHGPRNCIGHRYAVMQMKTILSYLLRKYTFHTTQRREDIKVMYGLVLESVPEIQLILRKRK